MREGNKIMKKIFSIFILMILFICGAVINVNAYTNNENMNSKEITNIITEAYQYRTKSIVDPSYIDKLELFYAKDTKIYNFEKNRYKNYIEMADRLNIKILNIKSNVEISNIKLKNNDECQVDLKEIISFDWINSNDDPINSKINKSISGWGSETTSSSLSRGDIIYYDWTGDGIWDHVAIVTGFDSSGAPLVSCHTTDYHNIKWNYGGSSCKYSCIHINNYI